MNYAYLHFFNIQYWYCVIVSLFGYHCTATGAIEANISAPGAGIVRPGFWGWLFGIGSGSASGLGAVFAVAGAVFGTLWSFYSALAYVFSFFLALFIAGLLLGIFLLRVREHAEYGNLPSAAEASHPSRKRWQELLNDAMSADPKRWRAGVFGADILLGELFSSLGYAGADTDAQIRRIPETAFANLSAAWEAHRVRNLVASPTSRFILTQREAFRALKLYEQVFREFDFI